MPQSHCVVARLAVVVVAHLAVVVVIVFTDVVVVVVVVVNTVVGLKSWSDDEATNSKYENDFIAERFYL